MAESMREDGLKIVEEAISAVLPDNAVKRALSGREFPGRVYLVAIGKAGWQMGAAACEVLGDRLEKGIVITKYGHVKSELPKTVCYEAGHPVPDFNSFKATQAAMDMVSSLGREDTVVLCISGGGSALFEKPAVGDEELQDMTNQLLSCGADIVEMNTIRKRLSKVKGGRFAQICAPAKVFAIVLSDILGDPLDMIASGPASPDASTCADAMAVVNKYKLRLSPAVQWALKKETPKKLDNVESVVTGSVKELARAAADSCERLGYQPVILTDQLCCQAREAGSFLASIAKTYSGSSRSVAFIAGGETVVKLTGKGKGGRNQEIALSAAEGIAGLGNVLIFSVGSDGTDGPTDAAGGMSDGATKKRLKALGLSIHDVLEDNDAYHALEKLGDLIMTGPTGTNVNDISVALIKA